MLQKAYNILKKSGIAVNLATLHQGECTAAYCVVYEGQTEPGKTVAYRHLLIDVYVPARKPETLQKEIDCVKAVMQAAGYRLPIAYPTSLLEEYKAITATLDYTIMCGQ